MAVMAKIKASHIKCGVCGTKFRSPISLGDTEAFQSATLVGNTASCPDCGRMIHCNSENMSYVLADDTGGLVGNDYIDNRT